jgi:hypothetical protein
MSHLEEGLLHALLDGEIPSDELPPIQAHLAGCAECRARLEAERGLLGEAAGLVERLDLPAAETTPRRVPVRAPWGRRLAWAASIVAALGLGYAARGWRVSPDRAPVQPLARVNTAAPPADSARALAQEVEPAADLPAPPATRKAPSTSRRPSASPPPRESPKVLAEQPQAKAADLRVEETVTAANRADTGAARQAAVVAGASERAAAPTVGRLQDAGAFRQLRAAPQPLIAPAEPIGLPDAVRRLGGSLRLVEGLVPLRLEAQGPTVRVVYAVAQGELVLSQQLVDGRIVAVLSGPPGFPADSLAKLRARVRE